MSSSMPTIKCRNFYIKIATEEDFIGIFKIYEDNYDSFFTYKGQDLYIFILNALEKRLLKIAIDDDKNIIAMINVLKINKEQLDRVQRGEVLNIMTEDVTSGTIDFVSSMWIIKDLRIDEAFLYKLHLEFARLYGNPDFRGLRNKKILRWDRMKERFNRRLS